MYFRFHLGPRSRFYKAFLCRADCSSDSRQAVKTGIGNIQTLPPVAPLAVGRPRTQWRAGVRGLVHSMTFFQRYIVEIQMDVFLQTLVAGILKGGLYALIGIGMTLIMGVMGIINLAHGQLMMLAMYITYVLFHYLGIDPYITLFISMPSLFLVGVLIQKFLLNPLMKVETILPENQVLMTVGIGMVLTEIIRFIFSSNYLSVKTSYATEAIFIGGISFSRGTVRCFCFRLSADRGALLVSHQDRPGALHSERLRKMVKPLS